MVLLFDENRAPRLNLRRHSSETANVIDLARFRQPHAPAFDSGVQVKHLLCDLVDFPVDERTDIDPSPTSPRGDVLRLLPESRAYHVDPARVVGHAVPPVTTIVNENDDGEAQCRRKEIAEKFREIIS